jgi:hypothetical protein
MAEAGSYTGAERNTNDIECAFPAVNDYLPVLASGKGETRALSFTEPRALDLSFIRSLKQPRYSRDCFSLEVC